MGEGFVPFGGKGKEGKYKMKLVWGAGGLEKLGAWRQYLMTGSSAADDEMERWKQDFITKMEIFGLKSQSNQVRQQQ